MMSGIVRRLALVGASLAILSASAAAIGAPPETVAAQPSDVFAGKTQDPYQLALRAYVWGYPLVRAAEIRQNMTLPADPFRVRPSTAPGAPINRMGHARSLATPESRAGVAPNNDTLYNLAWLDLNDGPFVLTTPDFGKRYYTFQMGQADSSTDVALGQRTHGHQLPPVFIQGPEGRQRVPAGMVDVRSTQRYLMIAGRILVDGEQDLPAVHALQDGIKVRRWADYTRGRDVPPPVSAQRPLTQVTGAERSPLQFLEMLGSVLRDWRTSPQEAALVRSFAAIGLTTKDGFRPDRLSPAVREALARGLTDGEASVRRKTFMLGKRVNGWGINYGGSQFGQDYLLRAAVAMDQIYVLPAAEALYPNARTDTAGKPLDGRNSYVLRFTKDAKPPVDAFWSATMYYAKGLMVPNPINRYAIGDRTKGLTVAPDGSLEIVMQHEKPRDPKANWLPTPDEPFMVMLRLYRPQEAARTGAWTPPGIVQTPPR
jgi:hypothetical protein